MRRKGLNSSSEEDELKMENSASDEKIYLVGLQSEPRDEFLRYAELQVKEGNNISRIARIDTRCPITLIKENLVENIAVKIPDVS